MASCSRCGRPSGGRYTRGHKAQNCYARTNTAGAPLAPRCKTCKQEGHTAKDCIGRVANSIVSRAGAAAASRAAPAASGGGSSHCSRCGRSSSGMYGHTNMPGDECYARTTAAATPLAPRCKTCKQEGHTARDCNGRAAHSFGSRAGAAAAARAAPVASGAFSFGSRAGTAAAARAAPVASGGGSSHCSRCGRPSSGVYGHTNMPGNECYARTTAAATPLAPRCKTCKQEGHTARDCNGRVAHSSKKRRASASTLGTAARGESLKPKKAKFAAARAAAMAKRQQRARAKSAQTREADPPQARRVTAAPRASSSPRATRRGVYVIECYEDGFFYVGKSEDITRRIAEHRQGEGMCAKWVKMHGGVKRVHAPMDPENSDLNAWEQAETTNRMLLHGFDKVRGWEFTTTRPLTARNLETIKTLIFGKHDACRKCGHEGHFAQQCHNAGKNLWLANIDRRLQELQGLQQAPQLLQRATSYERGPSLAELQGQSQQDDYDDYDDSDGRGGGGCGTRSCVSCGTDISASPPSHSKCMPCFIRSRSSQSQQSQDYSSSSEDDGRSCDGCGKDISDRPASHFVCYACYKR